MTRTEKRETEERKEIIKKKSQGLGMMGGVDCGCWCSVNFNQMQMVVFTLFSGTEGEDEGELDCLFGRVSQHECVGFWANSF